MLAFHEAAATTELLLRHLNRMSSYSPARISVCRREFGKAFRLSRFRYKTKYCGDIFKGMVITVHRLITISFQVFAFK